MVPFFVFQVKTHSEIDAEVLVEDNGLRKWEHETEYIQSDYPEIIACASCSVNQKLVEKLLTDEHGFSFHTQQSLPTQLQSYPPQNDDNVVNSVNNVLPIDITKEEAWEISGKRRIPEEEHSRSHAKLLHGNSAVRDLSIDTEFTNFQYFLVYLPIYFSSFSYGDKFFEVLVSGNRGVVVGNSPLGTGSGGKFIMDKLKSLSNLVSDTIPI